MDDIINEFWEHIEENRHKKSIEKIYQWLNKDNLSSIIVDNNVYWTELICQSSTFPQYAFDYIKNWCNKKGLTYLYDVPMKY